MRSRLIKKTLLWAGGSILLLLLVLVIHIVVVTSHSGPDAATRVMARIDVNGVLSNQDAERITSWLYRQKGVDHVLCNNKTSIAVFTYSPLKADANEIARRFSVELGYPLAKRYIPTEKELQGGCPVASTSFTYRIVSALRKIF